MERQSWDVTITVGLLLLATAFGEETCAEELFTPKGVRILENKSFDNR